jgi:16S rRNA (uracil1498-N3)-methyltransferase
VRHRIYVPELQTSDDVIVSGDEFHHAARVVRVREGEEVELFDGRGRMVHGKVSALARDQFTVAVEREIPSRESPLRVTLAMAIIQLEKFELVLQKATELGAYALIPLITDRVEVRPERYRGKADRWQKIIFEAVKQSGRALVPSIAEPMSFDDALQARDGGVRIIFDADAEASPERAAEPSMTLFIGPEGGWSERELELARAAGCRFGRLGPRRLRAETAAIVALAVTAARSGDLA